MPIIWHAAATATYLLVAAVLGVALSAHGFVAPSEAWIVGAIVVVLGAIAHETLARRNREAELVGEIRSLKQHTAEVTRELEMARTGVRLIRDALEGGKLSGGRMAEVAQEIEVLQRLVEQLWARQQTDEANRVAAGPVRAGSLAPPLAAGLDDAQILDMVRDGLATGRVDLFLQPIVSLPQRRRRFYECYSRIRARDGHMIIPEQYLATAARAGLATAIDNMLLFRCIQLVRKVRKRNANVGFVCNISRHSLEDREFLSDFVDYMRENAELGPSIVLEVAQADLDEASSEGQAYLDALADLGLRFSLDRVSHFGIDPARLAARNVRFVKLDARLVTAAVDDPGAPFHRLRRELTRYGIEVVVEKVETEQQLVELLELGPDMGQGFLFGEPKLSPEG